jgi:predicted PurR-regulated permease PerM
MTQSNFRIAFLLGLLLLVLWLTAKLFLPYIVTLSLAGTMAVVMHPLYARVLPRVWNKEWLASIVVVVLTMVLFLLPLTIVGIQVATQAAELYTELTSGDSTIGQGILLGIDQWIDSVVPGTSVDASQYVQQAVGFLAGSLGAIFAGTFATILQLIIGIFAFYYMLKDGHRFADQLVSFSPMPDREDRSILERLRLAIDSVMKGSVIVAVVQGIVTGIGLTIFGVEHAILLGTIAALGALVPTLGTIIVFLPVVAILVLQERYFGAVGLTLWGLLAVGFIDNLLNPFLIGRGTSLHPFFVLFSVLGGIALFGIAGFVLGPLIVSLLFALLDVYRNDILGAKLTTK